MSFDEKYLKYKNKYLSLKNNLSFTQYGGMTPPPYSPRVSGPTIGSAGGMTPPPYSPSVSGPTIGSAGGRYSPRVYNGPIGSLPSEPPIFTIDDLEGDIQGVQRTGMLHAKLSKINSMDVIKFDPTFEHLSMNEYQSDAEREWWGGTQLFSRLKILAKHKGDDLIKHYLNQIKTLNHNIHPDIFYLIEFGDNSPTKIYNMPIPINPHIGSAGGSSTDGRSAGGRSAGGRSAGGRSPHPYAPGP